MRWKLFSEILRKTRIICLETRVLERAHQDPGRMKTLSIYFSMSYVTKRVYFACCLLVPAAARSERVTRVHVLSVTLTLVVPIMPLQLMNISAVEGCADKCFEVSARKYTKTQIE